MMLEPGQTPAIHEYGISPDDDRLMQWTPKTMAPKTPMVRIRPELLRAYNLRSPPAGATISVISTLSWREGSDGGGGKCESGWRFPPPSRKARRGLRGGRLADASAGGTSAASRGWLRRAKVWHLRRRRSSSPAAGRAGPRRGRGLVDPPHQASRLAGAAERGDALVGGDFRDGRAAARAGLPAAQVDGEEVARLAMDVVAHLLANFVDRVGQGLAHGLMEADDLVGRQRRPLAIGIQPRLPQDLIGVGIADAGDERRPRQDALDLPAKRAQPSLKILQPDVERIRPHFVESRDAARVARQGELTHLLRVDVAQLLPPLGAGGGGVHPPRPLFPPPPP